ncbi:MAG TPA: tetratricopeptide repeat protein [Allosphingosinicella sp.]|jgi:hypothetical protein
MGGDDDIASALPRPPHPAPARREAAIAEAMRRFDGGEARPAAAPDRARPASRWPGPGRPYAGALAGALLVAVVGLPWAWQSFDDYPARRDGAGPGVSAPASQSPAADAEVAADASPEPLAAEPGGPLAADSAEPGADGPVPVQPLTRPVVKGGGPASEPGGDSMADSAADSGGEIVVTGSRISNPNLASSSPVTAIGGGEVAVAGARARSGDWNACTIEDPRRDLRACRSAGPVAKGVPARSASHVRDGLQSAWDGEVEQSIAAFDRAIEAAPRSSAAYLNRGLAWRRLGDRDRALADLDRAVRHDPRSARALYHRSLLLRERGETRRARADERRAIELDPSYEPLVRARRREAR